MRRSWLGVAERSLGASVAASDRQELGQSKQRDNLDPLNNLAAEMTEIAFVAGDEAAASTADRCTEEWSVLPVELDLQFEEDGRQDVDAFEQPVKTGTPRCCLRCWPRTGRWRRGKPATLLGVRQMLAEWLVRLPRTQIYVPRYTVQQGR